MLIIVFFFLGGNIFNVFPQHSFRNSVFLTHSSGSRLFDYDAYMNTDSTDISVPSEMDYYNSTNGYSGADKVGMEVRWFPVPDGTDWYNWLLVFRDELPNNDIWAKLDTFNVIVFKGGIQTTLMTGYGNPSDTTIAHATDKTVETYKWIWREILDAMESRSETFWVIMTGAAAPERFQTINGARLSHEFAVWATDTLATGNDPVYGAFPENVYIFDYFHYLADEVGNLKAEYEIPAPAEDFHQNATACEVIAPIFVQEVFDAAITYETTIMSVEKNIDLITHYTLEQNYPNPFNPSTKINYTLAKSGNITLKVYNSLGCEMTTLVNGFKNSGKHSVNFRARHLTSGIYFYRLKTDNFTSTRKMLLIK